MSSENEIETLPPINMPPVGPPPESEPLPAMTKGESPHSHVAEYRQYSVPYYESPRQYPIIYTLPVSKPITTKYEYLVEISHKIKCPIDSLQMALGPSLQIHIFYHACLAGDWFEMYHMIKDFSVDVNVAVSGSLPAIWFAAQHGYFEIVQNLLLMGADPNPVSPMTGLSAVDIAHNNRFGRTVYLLRAYGGKSAKPRPRPTV